MVLFLERILQICLDLVAEILQNTLKLLRWMTAFPEVTHLLSMLAIVRQLAFFCYASFS